MNDQSTGAQRVFCNSSSISGSELSQMNYALRPTGVYSKVVIDVQDQSNNLVAVREVSNQRWTVIRNESNGADNTQITFNAGYPNILVSPTRCYVVIRYIKKLVNPQINQAEILGVEWVESNPTMDTTKLFPDDIIIGKCTFVNGVLIGEMDYSKQPYVDIPDTYNLDGVLYVESTEPESNKVNVVGGSVYINGIERLISDQEVTVPPVATLRHDLFYIDEVGQVGVQSGTDEAFPTIPSPPVGTIPIASVTRVGPSNIVYGYDITNIPTKKFITVYVNESSGSTASDISYSTASTGLPAINVQEAIDLTYLSIPANDDFTLASLSEKNYSSLTGLPTIPVNSDFTLTSLGEKSYNSLTDKPSIPVNSDFTLASLGEHSYNSLIDKPAHDALTSVNLAMLSVDYGHVSDSLQTISGIKVFTDGTATTLATTNALAFNVQAVPMTSAPGLMQWNSTDGTLDLGIPNDVTMQLGQEMFVKVINKTGSTIQNGKAVYFSGRLGNRPTIALAKSDAHATSCVAGLTTQDIEDDAEGYVTTVGYVRQIKTDYGSWTAGAKLWVSKTTAGEVTITQPSAPHHSDVIGTVGIVGGAGIGSIFVNIVRHMGLEDLSDVNGTPLTESGQIPVWSQTSGYFDFDKNINNYELAADVVALETATKEPTGFTNNDNIDVAYNSTTKKITLTGTFKAYWRGTEITALVSGWTSEAILPGLEVPIAPYYLYYNGTNFIWSTLPWTFDMLQIAYVYYTAGGVFVFAQRECHGLMDYTCHEVLHDNIGTFLESGGDLSGVTIGSTTAALRRPDISSTTIKDEDLGSILVAKTDKLYNIINLTSTGIVNFTLDAADIVPLNGVIPYYNQFTGGAWQQTPMTANQYMCLWKIAIPVTSDTASQKYRYVWIQGQQQGTLASQQALTPLNLSIGNLKDFASEFVFIDRVIIRYSANNWAVTQIDKLTGSKVFSVSFTGGYLSTVTTDTSLTGTGTATSPLGINGILVASREYADNAAALTGGLVIGDLYRTGDTVKIVHA